MMLRPLRTGGKAYLSFDVACSLFHQFEVSDSFAILNCSPEFGCSFSTRSRSSSAGWLNATNSVRNELLLFDDVRFIADVNFESIVPALLGLPPVSGNIAEVQLCCSTIVCD